MQPGLSPQSFANSVSLMLGRQWNSHPADGLYLISLPNPVSLAGDLASQALRKGRPLELAANFADLVSAAPALMRQWFRDAATAVRVSWGCISGGGL
jgi:hypothetical protein